MTSAASTSSSSTTSRAISISSSRSHVSESIATLVEWAVSYGATLHPLVEVYRDARTGLSFRVKPWASGAVQPYEPIVQLPTSLTLSYLNAVVEDQQQQQHAADAPFHTEILTKAPPHVVGRLFLIREYLRGRASFWWPYIQALPQPGQDNRRAWALAPFWDPEEAELLDGTNVEVGIAKIRSDVRREFSDARDLLSAWQGPESTLNRALTAELYQWAYCIFSSRSFRPGLVLSDKQQAMLPAGVAMDDFSVLLPLFDIGNHDMTAEIRWDVDNDKQECALKVGRTYGPGEQVFSNYSMKTNAELLLGYGFMIPATDHLHNDYTHLRKRTATEPQASEEYLISLRPLSHPSSVLARAKQSLQLDPSTKVLGSFQHLQPEMVWDIICTLTTAQQRRQLVPVPEGQDPDRFHRDRFFSGQVHGEARECLEQAVAVIQDQVLHELERLNETDVEVVGGAAADLTRNQQLALDYRERCRRVLEGVLEAIQGDGIFGED
ncbi:hypothetical protein E4U41_004655 [Claviceps citrina]|nr:hypothetical protein E4U41_004655 [Claviceps citrina]